MLTADRHQMIPKTGDIEIKQLPTMLVFFGRHALKQGGRAGIGRGKPGGKLGIDAAVFLLGGDRQGENFALGKLGKGAAIIRQDGEHDALFIRMVLNKLEPFCRLRKVVARPCSG